MRNRYNYGELVKVSGEGKQFGKVENTLGFIIKKDDFYDDYYIELIFGEKDWFNENSIERVLGEKRNKSERFQVRLCTTEKGYELIKDNIKENEPISNNKFNKRKLYRKFEKEGNKYIAIGWKSTYWPISNKSIRIMESTIQEFRNLNIPFQYILVNEDVLSDIRIMEFCDNDKNVKVFSVDRNIRMRV